MPHDKNAIHVSHYRDSPTWRSAVAPEDRSWLLFIDVTGAPHLYLATETQADDGRTVTTYAPCVRAMLRPEDAAASMTGPRLDAQGFSITVSRTTDPACVHAFVAVSGSVAGMGSTRRAAVLEALEHLPEANEPDPLRDPSVAVLAL